MTAPLRSPPWRLIALFAVAFVCVAMCLGVLPVDLLVHVVFGWALYARDVLPRISVNWASVASAAVWAALLAVGTHGFCRWVYRESGRLRRPDLYGPAPGAGPRWPVRWTAALLGGVLFMFVAGTAAVGVVHQVAFLARSEHRAFDYPDRVADLNGARLAELAVGWRNEVDGEGSDVGRLHWVVARHSFHVTRNYVEALHVVGLDGPDGRLAAVVVAHRDPARQAQHGVAVADADGARVVAGRTVEAVVAEATAAAIPDRAVPPRTGDLATRPVTRAAAPPATQPVPPPASAPATAPAGSEIFPVPADVRRVAFVCDATGRMITKVDLLRAELNKAIEALRPDQSFNVIFFVGDGVSPKATPWVIVADTTGLMAATEENKRKVRQFMADVTVSGQPNPVPALRMALAQKPEVIYYLTDGEYNSVIDAAEVEAEVKRFNAAGRVRVNTVFFEGQDEETEEHLRAIARAHGGTLLAVNFADGTARPRPATSPAAPAAQ